jgi:nucleotide-binding universal stress UspA family protein
MIWINDVPAGSRPVSGHSISGCIMGLKDILVHLDGTPQSTRRLDLALDLARRHEAHLVGLYLIDTRVPSDTLAAASGGMLMGGLMERVREQTGEQVERVEIAFEAAVSLAGVSGEWRLVDGPIAATVALHARYADLAILGQTDPDRPDTTTPATVIEEVLFASGRPLLLVPYAGRFDRIGRNVLVGWNGSREAARALNDALPLMRKADRVTVLAADPESGFSGDGDVPSADIALHLARHGVKARAAITLSDGMDPADLLLNYASDLGADLLVMGGYGHSRLRELVLGGVTRSMLERTTLPVLMSR